VHSPPRDSHGCQLPLIWSCHVCQIALSVHRANTTRPPAFDLQAEKRKLMERLERITAVVRAGIARLEGRAKGLKLKGLLNVRTRGGKRP
jgi:hypothetical protein